MDSPLVCMRRYEVFVIIFVKLDIFEEEKRNRIEYD